MHFPRVVGVHVAGLLSRIGLKTPQRLFLATMRAFERMPFCWLRTLTGHYSAIIARRQ
jgi:hypothetical protein